MKPSNSHNRVTVKIRRQTATNSWIYETSLGVNRILSYKELIRIFTVTAERLTSFVEVDEELTYYSTWSIRKRKGAGQKDPQKKN